MKRRDFLKWCGLAPIAGLLSTGGETEAVAEQTVASNETYGKSLGSNVIQRAKEINARNKALREISEQKFHKGDRVHVGYCTTSPKQPHLYDVYATVLHSYSDKYGRYEGDRPAPVEEYSLEIDGKCYSQEWYPEFCLTPENSHRRYLRETELDKLEKSLWRQIDEYPASKRKDLIIYLSPEAKRLMNAKVEENQKAVLPLWQYSVGFFMGYPFYSSMFIAGRLYGSEGIAGIVVDGNEG